jgi:hypothetical protein
MSIYIPVVQTQYVLEGLFSTPKFQALLASGALDMTTLEAAFGATKAGDYVNIPALVQFPDMARIDISSAADLSPTAAATNDGKGVVLRDAGMAQWTRHDATRSGEDFMAKNALTSGNKIAKRLLASLGNILRGAIPAIDTPVTNSHVEDHTGAPMTVNIIRAAKARLQDNAEALTTCILHSNVWFDLIKDLQTSYTYLDTISGQVIQSAKLEQIMGINTFIISDDMPSVAAGFATPGDNIYHTFLLGTGSIFFAYQQEPLVEVDDNILKPSTLNYMKVSMDYVLHPHGFAWGGSANPTDANCYNTSNWTFASEDHRNIGLVDILTWGKSGA